MTDPDECPLVAISGRWAAQAIRERLFPRHLWRHNFTIWHILQLIQNWLGLRSLRVGTADSS